MELSDRLAGSAQIHECVVTQVFRYAAGRGETATDACVIKQLSDEYVDNNYNFRTLIKSVATHEAFRFRRTEDSP